MVVCVQRLPPEWNRKPACISRTDRACVSLHERFQAAFQIICLRILSDMEGDGDLMKMLMRADPPDESIQGPMDESAMVQSGVRF